MDVFLTIFDSNRSFFLSYFFLGLLSAISLTKKIPDIG